MSSANKVRYGLKNVYVAPLTETDAGIISFGTPRHVPGAVNLSLPPVGETTPFYADDIEYFTSMTNNGYEGNIEFALVPDWFKEKYLGEIVDENFVYTERAGVQPSRFAMMFEFDGDKRKVRHVLYNCKANRPNVDDEAEYHHAENRKYAACRQAASGYDRQGTHERKNAGQRLQRLV